MELRVANNVHAREEDGGCVRKRQAEHEVRHEGSPHPLVTTASPLPLTPRATQVTPSECVAVHSTVMSALDSEANALRFAPISLEERRGMTIAPLLPLRGDDAPARVAASDVACSHGIPPRFDQAFPLAKELGRALSLGAQHVWCLTAPDGGFAPRQPLAFIPATKLYAHYWVAVCAVGVLAAGGGGMTCTLEAPLRIVRLVEVVSESLVAELAHKTLTARGQTSFVLRAARYSAVWSSLRVATLGPAPIEEVFVSATDEPRGGAGARPDLLAEMLEELFDSGVGDGGEVPEEACDAGLALRPDEGGDSEGEEVVEPAVDVPADVGGSRPSRRRSRRRAARASRPPPRRPRHEATPLLAFSVASQTRPYVVFVGPRLWRAGFGSKASPTPSSWPQPTTQSPP